MQRITLIEFDNNNYRAEPDSVELTTSGIASGGMIEVWLNSIDSGNKVTECTIGNTGSYNVFKMFKAPVTSVSGNHNVYLKFVGSGTNNLFQLKWFNFSKKYETTSASLGWEKVSNKKNVASSKFLVDI